MKIILASSSPRRKEILSRMNIDFDVINPNIVEPEYDRTNSPKEYSEELSKMKALSISKNYKKSLVVAADTIVVLNNNIVLGKPKNKDDAKKTLNILSGKTHKVITSVTIKGKAYNTSKILKKYNYTFSEITCVKFLNLESSEILKYINTDSPYDKAGSYGIQDYSSIFVEKIDGCYDNVLGFPLSKFNYICKNILNIPI